jgi:hypothetical protein
MILRQSYILVVDLENEGLSDIVVKVKKPSSLTFETLDLASESIQDAEMGYYNIEIPSEIIDEIGTFVFQILAYETEIFTEKEAVPAPPYSTETPDICVVTGNVKDISGNISYFPQISVEARPLRLPALYKGTHILGQRVIVHSDHNGFFQLPLIRGMTALIEIKDAGIRFQASIPHQESIRIEDLMPNT